tara:strand:- start:92 stop:478 length:387 start_codon:yes stop_codon:yes gene_type:complete
VRDDRFSTVVPKLCRHDECAYEYLDKDEIDLQNCFVCSKQPVQLEYRCGMCVANSQINIDKFNDAVIELVLKYGELKKEPKILNQMLIYYTIKDLDTGKVTLEHFWDIPKRSSNVISDAVSDYLIDQT